MRWEKTGKIKKSKRDWRGWRFYTREDMERIRKFYEGTYEYETLNAVNTGALLRDTAIMLIAAMGISFFSATTLSAQEASSNFTPLKAAETSGANFDPDSMRAARANARSQGIHETPQTVDIVLSELPAVNSPRDVVSDSLKYTLGPDDVISIEVRRHPEFNGQYIVNSEGKIGYKYVGDVDVNGLTKKELKERVTEILAEFIISPEVDVQIVAYLSKVFYVVGDVNRPGKFYMKGDTIPVREALIQAGLPNQAASLGNCRLMTPDGKGNVKTHKIDINRLLYEGDLKHNLVMRPGDVLYVPPTFLAKIIRIISPVTNLIGQTAGSVAQGAAAAAVAL